MTLPTQQSNRLLVDGHVHVHKCFDEARFLAAAYKNLSARGEGTPTLLLTESSGENVFRRWRSGDCPWRVALTEEPVSLILGGKLVVIAGRQIATAERVEVLALLCDHEFEDGQPIGKTLELVEKAGGFSVLPWGVGKWLGYRGTIVREAAHRHSLVLGDNAGRPVFWPAPALFRRHVVLPGSDPLRLPGEEQMVGTYGFELRGAFDLKRPAEAVRQALRGLTTTPPGFGTRVGWSQFVRRQTKLRFNGK